MLQAKLKHKNILKLHENFEDKNDICMILEYCAKGNLY
jgi:serine/threonine protein kinase